MEWPSRGAFEACQGAYRLNDDGDTRFHVEYAGSVRPAFRGDSERNPVEGTDWPDGIEMADNKKFTSAGANLGSGSSIKEAGREMRAESGRLN